MAVTFEDLNFGDLPAKQREFSGGMFAALFPGLITPEKADDLKKIVFDGLVLRKDFLMPSSGNTPRHMSVVSGHTLNEIPEIRALYEDPRLRDVFSFVTLDEYDVEGSPKVCLYPDLRENIVATRLEKVGDTHGFHTDDPALAFVICLEAPDEDGGGDVEYILNFRSYFEFERIRLNKGDAYLMHSNWKEHRVMPLTKPGVRSILNLTYDFEGREVVKNGSAEMLFKP